MKTYWVLVKKNFDRGAYVPSYEVLTFEPLEGKKEALPPGYCLDLFKCSLSQDGTYLTNELWYVSNVDGVVIEDHVQTFFLQRG